MSIDKTRSDYTASWFADGIDPATFDPIRAARNSLKRDLPKRFWKDVSVEARDGLFLVMLDGKPARTRGKALLGAKSRKTADLVAAEWAECGVDIEPDKMPHTRILHTSIDHVAIAMIEVGDDILKYAASDAICYRVAEPEALVKRQEAAWRPVLEHISSRYGARFVETTGITFVAQPQFALDALAPRVRGVDDPLLLGALHVLTTISGSSLIALAVADGVLSGEAGFDAGEVDADYEVSIWGADEEAAARRAARLRDFCAAARFAVGP